MNPPLLDMTTNRMDLIAGFAMVGRKALGKAPTSP